jgi:hypothetical protein
VTVPQPDTLSLAASLLLAPLRFAWCRRLAVRFSDLDLGRNPIDRALRAYSVARVSQRIASETE